MREWKHAASTPEFLDFTIVGRDCWLRAKERVAPDADRVNWAALAEWYPKARSNGDWIEAALWFGFDVTDSASGTPHLAESDLRHRFFSRRQMGRAADVRTVSEYRNRLFSSALSCGTAR